MSVKKYCYCENNCKYETLDKEEILAAIAQAISTGTVGECDTGFITTIKTINGKGLKFFMGEQSEYEALSAEQKENLFAIITNDTTKEGIDAAIAALQDSVNDINNKYLNLYKAYYPLIVTGNKIESGSLNSVRNAGVYIIEKANFTGETPAVTDFPEDFNKEIVYDARLVVEQLGTNIITQTLRIATASVSIVYVYYREIIFHNGGWQGFKWKSVATTKSVKDTKDTLDKFMEDIKSGEVTPARSGSAYIADIARVLTTTSYINYVELNTSGKGAYEDGNNAGEVSVWFSYASKEALTAATYENLKNSLKKVLRPQSGIYSQCIAANGYFTPPPSFEEAKRMIIGIRFNPRGELICVTYSFKYNEYYQDFLEEIFIRKGLNMQGVMRESVALNEIEEWIE